MYYLCACRQCLPDAGDAAALSVPGKLRVFPREQFCCVRGGVGV